MCINWQNKKEKKAQHEQMNAKGCERKHRCRLQKQTAEGSQGSCSFCGWELMENVIRT